MTLLNPNENEKVIVARWRPPIHGHRVHVMIYREGRIVASESAADIAEALREAKYVSQENRP